MENGQTTGSLAADVGAPAGDSPTSKASSWSSRLAAYHPSAAFRRALIRRALPRYVKGEPRPASTGTTDGLGHAPRILSLVGAGLTVGATAGFLELSVQAVQLRVLHHIEWTSLTVSRHVGWMAVVTSALLSAILPIVLLAPALAWAAWRQRHQVPARRLAWTWDVAGAILGTLLFLGPLQTIHGLHPAASISLALGAGVRSRRWLVWARSPGSAVPGG